MADGTGMTDDDRIAAEWEASVAAEGEPVVPGATVARVMSQEEIDDMMGFASGAAPVDDDKGMKALVNSSMVNYERLPMLEVVFDRLVRLMSTTLRNLTQDNVEVSLDHIQSVRFGDYMNSVQLPAMLAVFKAEEWDNHGLMMIDSALIYSVVDVLLGGRQGTVAMRIEGRPYTTIERKLVERLAQAVLTDLSGAFDPLSPVTFRFDRLETNPRFAAIARPANAAVLVKLRVDVGDRGGRMELLIPYATLEPVRELLLQMFMGEKFGRDSIWEHHLATQLMVTDVDVAAVLDEVTMPLSDVLNWRVGTRILLNTAPEGDIELRCGDVSLFSGRMGRKGGQIAVRIGRELPRGVLPKG